MCSIFGYLKPNDIINKSKAHHEISQINDSLKHRGPDDHGIYIDDHCALAHNRLSIIDLTDAGKQPMTNEDGSILLTYNGELYNYRDLKHDYRLESKGHIFKSKTDTEVLIHLYEEFGIECIKKLNGMFAFALWDKKRQTLHLVRDRHGIKPLFYTMCNKTLYFASEIKALLAIENNDIIPNLESLYHYLSLNYIPAHLTAFNTIHELRPGHVLTLSLKNKKITIEKYFTLHYTINYTMSTNDAIDQSLFHLRKSVKRHLVSDVPVGVMLSGGMDSSSLTALMAELRGNGDFHTFSIGFEEKSFDESPYARIVSRHFGTQHHEIQITPDNVLDLLPRYLTYIDEPYADGSAIPTFLLSGIAKNYVTVLLSGEGGDEFFAGYDTHLASIYRNYYRQIPSFIRKNIINTIVTRLPVSHKKLSFDYKAKRFTHGSELGIPESHFYWREVLNEDVKQQILRDHIPIHNFPATNHFFIDTFNTCQASDDLNKLLYIDYSYHLCDDLMIKTDRMTMAHSLEARVPFMDNELVAFLSTVPVGIKMRHNTKKYLLKKALNHMLPACIINKKKVGLEMPYSKWFLHELREFCEDILSASSLNNIGLFNTGTVRNLWEEHCTLKADHGRFLWGLINYILWYTLYIKEKNYKDYRIKPGGSLHS